MSEGKNQEKKDPLTDQDESETGDSGNAGHIIYRDFIGTSNVPDEVINQAIHDMRQSLLGVAEVETDILKNIKEHLDHMLDSIYQQAHEYQNIVTMDNMVSDQPITKADPAIIKGLDVIAQNLNEKNAAINKLYRELEALGAGIFEDSGMSSEMLRQQVDELIKRNKTLKNIHYELRKHPMITGRVPKGMTIKDIKIMLEKLNEQINALNQTNAELKTQLMQEKLQTRKQTLEKGEKETPSPTFRRKH